MSKNVPAEDASSILLIIRTCTGWCIANCDFVELAIDDQSTCKLICFFGSFFNECDSTFINEEVPIAFEILGSSKFLSQDFQTVATIISRMIYHSLFLFVGLILLASSSFLISRLITSRPALCVFCCIYFPLSFLLQSILYTWTPSSGLP